MNLEQKLNKEVSTLFKRSSKNYKFVHSNSDLTYDNFLSDKMLIIVAIRTGIP
jgi:primase-polymerase (primpol)-like protein